MATFDKENMRINLSEEDKEMFKEVQFNVANKKTPIASSIIKSIYGRNYEQGRETDTSGSF